MITDGAYFFVVASLVKVPRTLADLAESMAERAGAKAVQSAGESRFVSRPES